MFYVYAPQKSRSAKILARKLEGLRIKTLPAFRAGDTLINWGQRSIGALQAPEGARILNKTLPQNKYDELLALDLEGLPVIETTTTLPNGEGWIPRRAFHQEGFDFSSPPHTPAFWSKKIELSREFRLHVFGDLILRWGEKFPNKSGRPYHPWVRSHSLGWRIAYGASKLPDVGFRKIARAACKALHLDFAALDMGLTNDNKPVILEVNSAPGLDAAGQTLDRYVRAFKGELE